MKILITGDWQTKTSNLNLSEMALKKELEIIKQHNIDVHIDLGDSKDDYSPVAVGVVNHQLKRARKLSKLLSPDNCFRLNGNHDRIGQHSDSRNWLPVFTDHAVCFDGPFSIQKSGWTFNFLPYNKDADELIKQVKRLAKKATRKSLLFFHCDVKGAKYSNVITKPSEAKLTTDDMRHSLYKRCFGGHIHKAQTLSGNVHYVGNPFPTDAGEVNQEKGFIVYDTEKDKITFVPSGLPSIFTFDYLQKKNIKKVVDGTQIKYVVKVLPDDDYYSVLEKAHDQIVKHYPNAIPCVVPDFAQATAEADEDAKIDLDATESGLITQYLDIVNKDGKERPAVEAYMKYVMSTITKKTGYAKGLVLDSVKARNILSFKDVEFSYRKKGVCLVRGINKDWPGHSNGAGKSNLLNLLPIAHSGKTFKDQKHGDIVNDYCPDEKAWVEWKCHTYSGDKLSIYRQFNPSKLQLTVNGVDASQGLRSSGKKDTQGLIEELTGYTFDTLANAVYIDQSISSSFLSGTDKDRAELLHKFQNLDRFALAQKYANTHCAMMKRLVEETEVSSEMQSLLEKETKERIAEVKNIQSQHLGKLKSAWKKAIDEFDQFKATNGDKIKTLISKGKLLKHKIDKQEEKLEKAKSEYTQAKGAVKWQQNELHKSVKYLKSNSKCTACYQAIPHSHKEKLIHQFSDKIEAARHGLDTLEKQVKADSQVLEQLAEKLDLYSVRLARMEKTREVLEEKVADAKLAYIEEKKAQGNQQSLDALQKKLATIRSRIQSLKELRNDQLDTLEVLAKASTGFGRDGLPLFLNKLVCPRLNAASKYYSDLFTDGEIQVLFLVENNKLVPRIVNAHGGKKLSGQSLGELAWAGIITAFAVRDIAQPTNVLILDEPGAGLDPAGAKQLGSKLSKLTDKFESLLVVTHNQFVEAALTGSNTVTVVKENKVSKLR